MQPLDLTFLIFTILLGSCVGSFLNVVIYRLPAGESIVTPPSHCPRCGYRLAWFDNIPILAWCWLRGRCRKCALPISVQYPLIELLTAALFGGAYWVFYLSDMRPEWSLLGVMLTGPAFIAYLILLAGLLAATIIDARYYIIPLGIPWFITAAAMVLLPWAGYVEFYAGLQACHDSRMYGPLFRAVHDSLPWVSGAWAVGAAGGMAGLVVANLLVYGDLLPRSFNEFVYDENPHLDEHDVFLQHPHPRKEMLKECAFLAFPVMGVVWGYALGMGHAADSPIYPVLGGVLLGYLAGGAVVWATRILGTFAFGKEAMGLGDVHLMAAVGAVAGWRTAVLAFFIAPFLGLTWALLSAGAQKMLRRQVRIIPYGPHLAIASVLVIVFHEPLMAQFSTLLGQP